MKPGTWQITLRPESSYGNRAVSSDWNLGTLVITAARIRDPNLTLADVLRVASYSGRYLKRDRQMSILSGSGLLSWAGDENGNGVPANTGGVTPGMNWQQALHLQFTTFPGGGGTSNCMGGLTEGSYFSTNGTAIAAFTAPTQKLPPRQFIDPIAQQVGVEYRVNPDGTFDSSGVGASGVFRQHPNLVLTTTNNGRDPSNQYDGLRVLPNGITGSTDVESFVTNADVYGTSGANGGAGTPPTYLDLLGDTVNIHQSLSIQSSSNTDCLNAATGFVDDWFPPRQAITVDVDEYCVNRFLQPGDYVYVFDPLSDFIGSTQVVFRGQVIFPLLARCYQIDWPLQEGMGVYIYANVAGGSLVDISDWVVWETNQPSRLTLGAFPRPTSSWAAVYQYA